MIQTFPEKGRKLQDLSTFGIGGEAEYYWKANSVEEMREAFAFAKEHALDVFILGRGSNCLFDDRGFKGLILHNAISFCEYEKRSLFVGAGYSFSSLGKESALRGLSGLEFACGIPASVGGAIFMNAGAFGKETATALRRVFWMNLKGEIEEWKREDLEFSYRHSSFCNMQGAILSAEFSLSFDKEAFVRQSQFLKQRQNTQPLEKKSAGCIFRNPSKEYSAGFLIEQCGLKGKRIGGALVSEKHANFIVNEKGALAKEVLELIAFIKEKVQQTWGIELQEEVKYIPSKGF